MPLIRWAAPASEYATVTSQAIKAGFATPDGKQLAERFPPGSNQQAKTIGRLCCWSLFMTPIPAWRFIQVGAPCTEPKRLVSSLAQQALARLPADAVVLGMGTSAFWLLLTLFNKAIAGRYYG
jgi:hypothetical protein